MDGPPTPRRERAALRGWQDSIAAGHYAQVRYLAHPATASFEQMAVQIGLTAAQFIVGDRIVAREAPEPADLVEKLAEAPAPAEAPPTLADLPQPASAQVAPRAVSPEEPLRPPELNGEQQQLIRELVGQDEPARRCGATNPRQLACRPCGSPAAPSSLTRHPSRLAARRVSGAANTIR